jgi:PAS domain-containing protein
MSRINAIPQLRAKAEKRLGGTALEAGHGKADPTKLMHELQVHQVELEMQNEALVEALNEADELRMKYHDLYDFAPVAYLTVTTMGSILEANLEATKMLGLSRGKLLNRRLQEFFDPTALPEVHQFFSSLTATTQKINARCLLLLDDKPIPHYVDAQGRIYVDPLSHVKRIRVVLMDVTALKLATDDVVNVISGFGDLK